MSRASYDELLEAEFAIRRAQRAFMGANYSEERDNIRDAQMYLERALERNTDEQQAKRREAKL